MLQRGGGLLLVAPAFGALHISYNMWHGAGPGATCYMPRAADGDLSGCLRLAVPCGVGRLCLVLLRVALMWRAAAPFASFAACLGSHPSCPLLLPRPLLLPQPALALARTRRARCCLAARAQYVARLRCR